MWTVMVEKEILSHAQQEDGSNAQVYRHSLLSKSKVVCLLKVLYHKDMFHVFVFYHVYFILVKGVPDTH
jgi:hypothetical protein